MHILVLGAGAYVCGRGGEGFGTILPSLAECYRDGLIDRVTVAATTSRSIRNLQEKLTGLNDILGTRLSIQGFPQAGDDSKAFRIALAAGDAVDAAIVVTPDPLHFEHAAELIEAGIHCLVVKPLTPTMAESLRLVKLAEDHTVYGAVEFHKRWDEANLHLKSIFQSGRLGLPLYAVVEYSQKKQVPTELFRAWSARTNIFQYLGVHYVDILYFVTGARPVRSMAVGQKRWLIRQGIDTWDAIQATIEWEDVSAGRFHTVIAVNWIDPDSSTAMSDQTLSFVGTAGRYDSDQKRRGVRVTTDEDGPREVNPYFSEILPAPDGHSQFRGYGYRSVRQFVEDAAAVRAGSATPADFEGRRPTFRDALVSTAVIDAVNRSLASGGEWIDVPAFNRQSVSA